MDVAGASSYRSYTGGMEVVTPKPLSCRQTYVSLTLSFDRGPINRPRVLPLSSWRRGRRLCPCLQSAGTCLSSLSLLLFFFSLYTKRNSNTGIKYLYKYNKLMNKLVINTALREMSKLRHVKCLLAQHAHTNKSIPVEHRFPLLALQSCLSPLVLS